jgi:hypothetical protein
MLNPFTQDAVLFADGVFGGGGGPFGEGCSGAAGFLAPAGFDLSLFIDQNLSLDLERGLILEVNVRPFVHLKVSAGRLFCSREKLPGK